MNRKVQQANAEKAVWKAIHTLPTTPLGAESTLATHDFRKYAGTGEL